MSFMILFKDDWKAYPSAIVDYETSNTSFLEMAALYRKMGIKNCLFHLALLQPHLQGVDPHSPDLTDDQKVAIDMECRYNPWYYFREVARIPPQAGPVPVQFKANRGNLALLWCFFCNIDIALIQPRQTGKSVSTDVLMNYLIFIAMTNATVSLLTKDDGLRRTNVSRLKRIRDLLPQYLVDRTGRDSDNQIEITCNARNTRYITGVSQGSERAANNLGRGMTVPINHIDEPPFINFIGTTLPAALASSSAARDEAERNGMPYGNIFTTTAGKIDDRDGFYMYKFITDGAYWNETYFDARDKFHARDLIKGNCYGRKVLINGTFSHRQLGKTDEWLYEKIVEANAKGEEADRDFFNKWTSGSQSSPLSQELNNAIANSEEDPMYSEICKDNYIVRWYIEEEAIDAYMNEGRFVIGLDTSEAVGRDNIGMVVTDTRDLSTVAAATINETNLIHFANFLGRFMIRFKNTVLVPERKSTGGMIIDSLHILLEKEGEDPFRRIYNDIVNNSSEREEEYRRINLPLHSRPYGLAEKYRKLFGFNTTGDSRKELYSTCLNNAAKKAGHLVRDRELSQEIRHLVVKKGRIDHETSGHDDMVVAWLLCEWFLTHAKNLSHYGIDPASVLLSKKGATSGEKTASELFEEERQLRIQSQIEQLYEELQNADDEVSALRIEGRLRSLSDKVIETDEETFTIDGLIKQASKERRKKAELHSRVQEQIDPAAIWGGHRGHARHWNQDITLR